MNKKFVYQVGNNKKVMFVMLLFCILQKHEQMLHIYCRSGNDKQFSDSNVSVATSLRLRAAMFGLHSMSQCPFPGSMKKSFPGHKASA